MRKHFGLLSQYAIGVLFGWGLIISGMSNPQKVLGFLDLTGNWDPSLMFVMMSAVIVGLGGFYLVRKRSQAFFGGALHIPTRRDGSKPLVIGSIIFGVGLGNSRYLSWSCFGCYGCRSYESPGICGRHADRYGNLRTLFYCPQG